MPSKHEQPGWRDVFNARLLNDAQYDGPHDIPWINTTTQLPNRLIAYSEAKRTNDTDQWVCFYQEDHKFLHDVWEEPDIALRTLQRFKGVITPDFSMYRDMPLVQQEFAIFMGHAAGHYWHEHGIPVIPNVRWGDERTYEIACNGVPRCSTISIGALGCLKDRTNRQIFVDGLAYVMDTLSPKTLVVYGSTPEQIFAPYTNAGVNVLRFPSQIELAHHKEVV